MRPREDTKNEAHDTAPAPPIGREGTTFSLLAAGTLTVLVCTAYTAVASILLWAFLFANPGLESPEFVRRLAMKAGVACAVAVLSLGPLHALAARLDRSRSITATTGTLPRRPMIWILPAIMPVLILMTPNLAEYPRAAPDELHHLVVAKNLAQYGLYASGHPAKGFKVFDPFDSVGAPVILPVAAAFKLFGVEIAPARFVIAAFFLGLCVAVWFLIAPVFGPAAGTGAAMFMTVAYSSLYLGRTLYGEVPGFFFLVVGLVFWRRALGASRVAVPAVIAGVALGLAILCKTIMILSVFAVAGAVLLDWLTVRRVRVVHLAFPAVGVAIVIGGWFTVQMLANYGVSENAGDTLGLYRQYLLPGLGATLRNVRYLTNHPYAHGVMFCCVAFVASRVFRRQYDPALIVLLLAAAFYVYWWFVFTPGRHVRYLWYGYAVSGMCVGIVVASLLTHALSSAAVWWRRALSLIAAGAVAGPGLLWGVTQGREIMTNSEMTHDRALAAHLSHLPAGAQIGSTHYPVRGTVMFLAGRWVDIDENRDRLAASCDVIIDYGPAPPAPAGERVEFGPYTVTKTARIGQPP